MWKYVLYGLLVIVIVGLFAVGLHLLRVRQKNKREMAPYAGAPVAVTNDFGRVLVVYYSLSGNTRVIAQKIQARTKADIYEIKTVEPLPSGPALYTGVRKQIRSKSYPAVQGGWPELADYDVIFVGAPVWWYTAATPLLAFLEQADFHGKKVAFFSTQGSNPGTFMADVKAAARHAVVLEGRGFNNLPKEYDGAVDNKIAAWLNALRE